MKLSIDGHDIEYNSLEELLRIIDDLIEIVENCMSDQSIVECMESGVYYTWKKLIQTYDEYALILDRVN